MPSRTLSPFKLQLPGQVWLQVATGGPNLLSTALLTADKEKRINTSADPPKYKQREATGQKSSVQGQVSCHISPTPTPCQASHLGGRNPPGCRSKELRTDGGNLSP